MNIRGYRVIAIDNKKRKLYYDDFEESKEFQEDFFFRLIAKYLEGRYCINKTFKLLKVYEDKEVLISEVTISRV